MRRVLLRVAYDGTDFHGWQYQPNARSVEGELNIALCKLTGEDIVVIGASRTDAGVHGLDNIAVFDTESTIPGEKFAYALNTILPADVKVQKSYDVDADFHPRKRKTSKTYGYRIYQAKQPNPVKDRYAYYVNYDLNVEAMKEAARYLIGEHDFKSFASVHTQALTTVRTIYNVEVKNQDGDIVIEVTGNGFLYNMVRIIAGTLIEIGKGRWEPEYIKTMIQETDRIVAGPTAPACGLMLLKIDLEE